MQKDCPFSSRPEAERQISRAPARHFDVRLRRRESHHVLLRVCKKTEELFGTDQIAIFHSLASTHSSGPRVTRPWLEESRFGCCMKNISVIPRWLFDLYVDSSDNHFGALESQLQSKSEPPEQVLFSVEYFMDEFSNFLLSEVLFLRTSFCSKNY